MSLEEVATVPEMLFYTFNNMGSIKAMPDKFKGTVLEKLYNLCRFAAMGINLQMDYIREFMADLDTRSQLRSARELATSEGRAEGRAEGLEKGRAEGRAEGLEKGRAEGKAEVAAAMKARGMSVSDIADITGLSAEQISKL